MTRSVVEIAAAMHSGSITARALAERFLDEQSRLDAQLHSFVAVRADDVLAQADRVDDERHRGVDRGPLHGVLIGVKDIVDVAGYPTRCGSPLYPDRAVEHDAEVVTHLRRAGAVIAGKTATHELACGVVTAPTANPWSTHRVPGGSSGGSGSAVGAGLVPIIEPEVDIKTPNKDKAEDLLKAAIMKELNALNPQQLVMLKLTIPDHDNLYADCVKHKNVLRVVALSGGYPREDANKRLARNLGMTSVAEGIQQRPDWDLLHSLGCERMQRYFIARPMPAERLAAWVAHWNLHRAGPVIARQATWAPDASPRGNGPRAVGPGHVADDPGDDGRWRRVRARRQHTRDTGAGARQARQHRADRIFVNSEYESLLLAGIIGIAERQEVLACLGKQKHRRNHHRQRHAAIHLLAVLHQVDLAVRHTHLGVFRVESKILAVVQLNTAAAAAGKRLRGSAHVIGMRLRGCDHGGTGHHDHERGHQTCSHVY